MEGLPEGAARIIVNFFSPLVEADGDARSRVRPPPCSTLWGLHKVLENMKKLPGEKRNPSTLVFF